MGCALWRGRNRIGRGSCEIRVTTQTQFFADLCKRFGWSPTPWRVQVFNYWANHEFPDVDGNGNNELFDKAYNPLATTWITRETPLNLSFNNGNGPGFWNSVPVKVYANYEAGLTATELTLRLSYYFNIRRCFLDQKGYEAAIKPEDFATWVGSEAYGRDVVNFMNTTTASKSGLLFFPLTLEQRIARVEAAVGGAGLLDRDGNTLRGETALHYADVNGFSAILSAQEARQGVANLAKQMLAITTANNDDVRQALIDELSDLLDRLQPKEPKG